MKNQLIETISYQFTAIPTNLFILLDVNCRSMLFTLIQLSSYYADKEGFFFRTNMDLQQESDLSQKLVNATIDTLYRVGIVDVIPVGKSKGKQSNRFRLNFRKIMEYEKYSMDDLKNPELKINMVNYREKGYSPKYLQIVSQKTPQSIPNISQNTNNIDNLNNKENKDINKNTIDIELTSSKDKNNIINNSDTTSILNKIRVNTVDKNIIISSCVNAIEEDYNSKIGRLLNEMSSTKEILAELAATDKGCYDYYKAALKEYMPDVYMAHREVIEELNLQPSITQQYELVNSIH